MTETVLEIDRVSKSFGDNKANDAISSAQNNDGYLAQIQENTQRLREIYIQTGAVSNQESVALLAENARLDGLAGDVSGVRFAELEATVSGDGQRLRVDDLTGSVLGARISARLGAEPRDEGIAWDAALELSAVDLAALRPWLESPLNGSIGAKLTTLSQEQANYIDVPVQGPYKPEHYKY